MRWALCSSSKVNRDGARLWGFICKVLPGYPIVYIRLQTENRATSKRLQAGVNPSTRFFKRTYSPRCHHGNKIVLDSCWLILRSSHSTEKSYSLQWGSFVTLNRSCDIRYFISSLIIESLHTISHLDPYLNCLNVFPQSSYICAVWGICNHGNCLQLMGLTSDYWHSQLADTYTNSQTHSQGQASFLARSLLCKALRGCCKR